MRMRHDKAVMSTGGRSPTDESSSQHDLAGARPRLRELLPLLYSQVFNEKTHQPIVNRRSSARRIITSLCNAGGVRIMDRSGGVY